MYLQQNIRFLRKKTGLSQTKLGDRVSKTKEVMSTYERGVTIPPLEVIIELCKIFKVSIDDFVFHDIEKEGTTGAPAPNVEEPIEKTVMRLNELLEARVKVLERELKRKDPDLAKELGIK